MSSVPDSLIAAFDRWNRAGRTKQEPFRWRPKSWIRRFSRPDAPQIPGIDLVDAIHTIETSARAKFDGKKTLINRDMVTSLHRPEVLTPQEGPVTAQAVVTAFIAAMIWGYGTTGYGPYRTERVLTSDANAVDHLRDVAQIAQGSSKGGLSAFEEIAKKRAPRGSTYLKFLGPAFGTKFLYFLTAAADGVETAPVMDAVVRRWFAAEPDVTLYTTGWHTDSYRRYLDLLDQWRLQLSAIREGEALKRDDVEFLIFATARGDTDSWTEDSAALAPDDLSVDQLLDLLQNDIEELAGTRGPKGPELFQQLSAWVAGTDNGKH